ncbi:MAG TPA: hypothetical protein VGK73_05800, partial [Polyangiaceae bacterium]
ARQLVLASLSALAAFLVASSQGCGTDAKGVDDCRDIERARCDVAPACGIVSDADECRRYYRDHCLHGLAVEAPPRNQVDDCVAMLKRAGACAQASGPATALEDCPEDVSRKAILAPTVCELVRFPERADECAFLLPTPLEEPPGAGGAPGGGGSEEPGGSGSGGEGG